MNLFADIPVPDGKESLLTLLKGNNIEIERIVSSGQRSPEGFWYDQDFSEWVIVLKGRSRLRFEGEQSPVDLGAGDYINIPAHKKHRVEWTEHGAETIWLAVHYHP